jgi:hypothetical protein
VQRARQIDSRFAEFADIAHSLEIEHTTLSARTVALPQADTACCEAHLDASASAASSASCRAMDRIITDFEKN